MNKVEDVSDSELLKLRKYPVGAEIIEGRGVHFRVWAPERKQMELVVKNENESDKDLKSYDLISGEDGYFSLLVEDLREGTLYGFRIDGKDYIYPDPASRFQPEGVHSFSRVIDPKKFKWTDHHWKGVERRGQVVYEMHIGTFTQEGTFEAAIKEFKELKELGITVLEIMPVAEFPGRFGWGYDGVDMFAPMHLYGNPDDLRQFVNEAHNAGLGVILDVVYNHLGPDGNYLKAFSEDYFTSKYENEWGEAINFDGKHSRGPRDFFTANAHYWIDEFHMDGLRLDATQQIFDSSEKHILIEITEAVRQAANGRSTYIVSENEPQDVKLIKPVEKGGYGMDGLWNDDFHHSAMVALSGHNEAYYTDYLGKPQEFISSLKYGFLYQGQYYKWQKKKRGTVSLGMDPSLFVIYIQNHDQVANSGRGLRAHQVTSPGRYKAMTALMILAPGTPMLFQGQEFAAENHFYYFADHNKELAKLVKKGRFEFLAQFPSLATPEMQACLPDPASEKTFKMSKLNFADREKNREIYNMHRDLLKLRREDPVLSNVQSGLLDGAVLSDEAFLIRFFSGNDQDRLLLINLGRDLNLNPAPEPLLSAGHEMGWEIIWSSENPQYSGCGTPEMEGEENWNIPGHSAVLLKQVEQSKERNNG